MVLVGHVPSSDSWFIEGSEGRSSCSRADSPPMDWPHLTKWSWLHPLTLVLLWVKNFLWLESSLLSYLMLNIGSFITASKLLHSKTSVLFMLVFPDLLIAYVWNFFFPFQEYFCKTVSSLCWMLFLHRSVHDVLNKLSGSKILHVCYWSVPVVCASSSSVSSLFLCEG